MRCHHRKQQQRVDVAERGTWDDHREPVHELHHTGLIKAFDLKAENTPIQTFRKLTLNRSRIRMVWVCRIVHAVDGRMRGQPGCEFAGVLALPLKAHCQRLNAAHSEVRLEWTQHGANNAGDHPNVLVMLFVADDYAT